MADGQANDVRLDLRQLTDMAVAFEQGDAGGLPMRLRHGMEPATGLAMAAAADLRGVLREVVGGQRIALAQHRGARSEEHTSGLQSLMRTSYTVFCLNNKSKKLCLIPLFIATNQQHSLAVTQ